MGHENESQVRFLRIGNKIVNANQVLFARMAEGKLLIHYDSEIEDDMFTGDDAVRYWALFESLAVH